LAVPITPLTPPSFAAVHASSPLASGGETRAARAAAEELEAFVLQHFVEAMLPREAESVYGRGTAGAFWKSMLAEHVARELARSGGVGIARVVAPHGPGQ